MVGNGLTKTMQGERGFSLLEAVVALLILIIGIAGVVASFRYHVSNSVAMRNQVQAALIANNVLTELANTNPKEWDVDLVASNYMYNFQGEPVVSEAQAYYTVSIADPVEMPGYFNVSIGVNWTGWRVDTEKADLQVSSTNAYVLDASLATLSDEQAD